MGSKNKSGGGESRRRSDNEKRGDSETWHFCRDSLGRMEYSQTYYMCRDSLGRMVYSTRPVRTDGRGRTCYG